MITTGQVKAYTSPGRPSGFVNDFANIIPDDDQQAMEDDLGSFAAQTSNEIVVVTVVSLDGDSIENYANELFREWGIGDAERNNGVLLLVAPNERKTRIEIGYGLEGAITDLESGRIVDGVLVPAFREGDYAGGINQAVSALKEAAQGEYDLPAQKKSKFSIGSSIIQILFFGGYFIIMIGSFLARSKSIWAGGIIGAVLGVITSFLISAVILKISVVAVAIGLGLLLDWLLSRSYKGGSGSGGFWGGLGGLGGGSSGGSSGGGGFGGFGGGGSGGGGSSGSW